MALPSTHLDGCSLRCYIQSTVCFYFGYRRSFFFLPTVHDDGTLLLYGKTFFYHPLRKKSCSHFDRILPQPTLSYYVMVGSDLSFIESSGQSLSIVDWHFFSSLSILRPEWYCALQHGGERCQGL